MSGVDVDAGADADAAAAARWERGARRRMAAGFRVLRRRERCEGLSVGGLVARRRGGGHDFRFFFPNPLWFGTTEQRATLRKTNRGYEPTKPKHTPAASPNIFLFYFEGFPNIILVRHGSINGSASRKHDHYNEIVAGMSDTIRCPRQDTAR
jgi:hypothetical protein